METISAMHLEDRNMPRTVDTIIGNATAELRHPPCLGQVQNDQYDITCQ